MVPQGSLPCSQDPTPGPYPPSPESVESSPRPHILLMQGAFLILSTHLHFGAAFVPRYLGVIYLYNYCLRVHVLFGVSFSTHVGDEKCIQDFGQKDKGREH
jgi:hypothetical protein